MVSRSPGKLGMGPGTLEVPMELFELNRKRLIERLRKKNLGKVIVFLEGGNEVPFNDTDVNYTYRQESYFMWTFGVPEPGYAGAIDIESGEVYLFAPYFPKEYGVWMGPLNTHDFIRRRFKINNVYYVTEIASVLEKLLPTTLLTLKGLNTDSGLEFKEGTFEGIKKFKVNNEILFPEIAELRVIKTDLEIKVLKYVCEVSSAAHRKVMRFAKPGKFEYNCESEFLHYCYNIGGCRNVSYTCICASERNAAVLHYGHAAAPNDRQIVEGNLCLFDMGANYFGYAADITCTFPVNGKFTSDQKLVYEAVLKANLAVFNAAKPGISWPDMHLLANRVLLTELKNSGLLRGDVDEMITNGLAAIFQPHGLGHLLGLDVHDVGGYLEGHPKRLHHIRGLDKLRTARILQDGMVLTIEPGCYFINMLLDEALRTPSLSKFLIPEVIERFRNFGGVRIEDDVLITANGVVNLTKVPRTVQEIEDWMAGKDDNKY